MKDVYKIGDIILEPWGADSSLVRVTVLQSTEYFQTFAKTDLDTSNPEFWRFIRDLAEIHADRNEIDDWWKNRWKNKFKTIVDAIDTLLVE